MNVCIYVGRVVCVIYILSYFRDEKGEKDKEEKERIVIDDDEDEGKGKEKAMPPEE